MNEAHVQHAVGFVEHQHLNSRKVDVALLGVIEQTTGCGNEDVDAVSERRNLRVDGDAAKNDERLEGQVSTVGTNAVFNLSGQLARRCQNQHPYLAWPGHPRGGQTIENRQGKAGGLAGTCLCAGHQVTSGEHDRNRLSLNRRGGFVALIGNGTKDLGYQTQFGKFHAGELQAFAMRARKNAMTANTRTSLGKQQVGRARRECLARSVGRQD